jgi:hypothetical protein
MSITSSFTLGVPQIDGRVWVNETHIDQLGVIHQRTWLAVNDEPSIASAVENYGQTLESQLQQDEIDSNIVEVMTYGAQANPVFTYTSLAQNIEAFRQGFATATPAQALMTAAYLASRPDELLTPWMTADQLQLLRSMPTLETQAQAIALVVSQHG